MNTERLRLFDLPVFKSVENLSSLCHVPSNQINEVLLHSFKFYKRVPLSKKSGGKRIIYQPNTLVKALQAWILRHILDKINPSHHATAFRKNVSIKNNVEPHQYNRFFFCLDLQEFFPSIKIDRVYTLFLNVGYNEQQAQVLARLCVCGYFLPQGGITSPSISNLVVNRLDRRLSGYCSKKHIVYTRYADDMTFSSNNRSVLNNSTGIIKSIICDEGFEINPNKIRFVGPSIRCKITGLVKNSKEPKFGIGKKKKNWMRSVIFNLIVNKKAISAKYQNMESVLGWLSYVKHVDESSYDYLNTYMKRLQASSQGHENQAV